MDGGEDSGTGLVRVQSFIEDIVKVDVAIRAGGEGITHELAGMGDGEALEEDGVGEQEDGGVGADAEGQGDEGDDRIAWGLTELAQRVAKIMGEGEHRIPPEVELTGYRLQVAGIAPVHSSRMASMGSMEAARPAGKTKAKTRTARSTARVARAMTGLPGVTP